MRLANQLKCGMSTNPISSFVLCVWKFANLPPSTQQETDSKSVQLFIVFLPVLPQETVPAANGAQQRLHSLVRIRDTRVVRPLTHLRTAIANTAVLPLTLKWSSAVPGSPAYPLRLDITAQGLWMGPVRHLLMLSDMHELLNCSRKVLVTQEFIHEGCFAAVRLYARVNLRMYTWKYVLFIFIDRFPSHCFFPAHPKCVFWTDSWSSFTIIYSERHATYTQSVMWCGCKNKQFDICILILHHQNMNTRSCLHVIIHFLTWLLLSKGALCNIIPLWYRCSRFVLHVHNNKLAPYITESSYGPLYLYRPELRKLHFASVF